MNIDSPNNTTSSNSSENDICFICLEHNDNTSITPCNCKTSVHYACILNWINHKSNVFCELCNEQYTIHNIYNNENNNVDIYDNINMNDWFESPYNVYPDSIVEYDLKFYTLAKAFACYKLSKTKFNKMTSEQFQKTLTKKH